MNNEQEIVNNNFLNIYKNTLIENNIDIDFYFRKLKEFEKKDINDILTKKIIKIMLKVPYYENNRNVNDLRKFQI